MPKGTGSQIKVTLEKLAIRPVFAKLWLKISLASPFVNLSVRHPAFRSEWYT